MLQNMTHNQISWYQIKSSEFARMASQAIIENINNLTEIHFELTKEFTTLSQATISELSTIKDVNKFLPITHDLVLKNTNQYLLTYQGKLYQAVCQCRRELTNAIDSAVDDTKSELSNLVDSITENTPKGSEVYLSTFKTVFEAMLQHFDQIQAVANEVFGNFESSIDSFLTSNKSLNVNQEKITSKKRVKQIEVTE